MTLSGSRGIVRVSKVPCELQAAMAVERVRELEFFQSITGKEYPGEYGERASAHRRGSKFERAAYANNAAELRRSLAPRFGYDPEEMWVRDFEAEVPGPPTTMRALRLARFRRVLGDLAQSRDVPHLVLQPQLRLPIRPEAGYFEYISPDFMVLDPDARIYVPGELKSFIERDGVSDGADKDLVRRQAGVQIAALRGVTDDIGLADRVAERAIFVYATPYGLTLGPPHEEALGAECHEVRRAIAQLADVHRRLEKLRQVEDTTLANLAGEFDTDYQEACHQTCVLAGPCKEGVAKTARELGDDAAELVGAEITAERLADLAVGAAPASPDEESLAGPLRDAMEILEGIGVRRAA